jgi:hypothetical protein
VPIKKPKIESLTISEPTIKFAKLSEFTTIPIPMHGSKVAASFDLYAAHEIAIPAKGSFFNYPYGRFLKIKIFLV